MRMTDEELGKVIAKAEKKVGEIELKSAPFSWNDNFSEIAIEDFNLFKHKLSYGTSQSIGLALAKLEILEKQGCKVEEDEDRMKLDETIKHYEEEAEKQENNAKIYPKPQKNVKGSGKKYNARIRCAKEYRQLAKWLKELKKLREIPDKLVPKYRDGVPDEYNRGANEMLEEVIDDIRNYMEEMNADEKL